jgi:hypothetical protein
MAVRIVRGTLVPDAATVRKVARAIQKELKASPKLRAAFRKDPRGFLGTRGLPLDSQRELLSEAGFKFGGAGEICIFTCLTSDCCVTCVTSNCCLTCFMTHFFGRSV